MRLGQIGLGLSKWRSGGSAPAPATPILDTITGAGAAYSMRKLRAAYAGSAIRVRRSSDNTEQDIGFDSNGDLDTAALSTFVGANSGFVVTWYDQTTNARHISQSDTASQPRIVNAGTLETRNSKPALNFYQTLNRGLTNTSPFAYNAGAHTIFAVAQFPYSASNETIFEERNTSTNARFLYRMGNTTNSIGVTIVNDALTVILSTVNINTNAADNTFNCIAFRDSGTSLRGHLDGAQTATTSYTRPGPLTPTLFGIYGRGSTYYSEFIVYPSDLSNTDFNTVTAEQGGEYGITVSPFLTAPEQLALINGTGDGGQSLALNIENVNDFNEPIYVDRAKQARGWLNGSDFGFIPSANLNSDGDLASLPVGETSAKFFFSSTGSDPTGDRGGRFRLTFTGSASVNLTTAGTNITTIDANTYEFDCDYVGNKWVVFTPTVFPIRVSIVKTSDLTAHAAGQYFRQEFLDFIPTGATLRFMNPMVTNSSPYSDWSGYPTTSKQVWSGNPSPSGGQRGTMPFMAMIDLCNQKSAHPWFCIPHMATDDFVTQMATVIRDNLDADLRARFELSNEIWNFSISTAGNYFEAQALADWGTSGGTNWLSAAGKRFVECMAIINSVFAGQTHRVIGVLAGQAAGDGIAEGMLDAPDWLAADPSNYVAPYTVAKEWAIAPYIGFDFGPAVTAIGNDIKAALDISHADAVAEIKSLFPTSVPVSKGYVDRHARKAAPRGLRLTMYEYNNHYNLDNSSIQASSLWSGGSPVAGALNAFVEATYSQEMADALDELRDYFKSQNGSLMALYKGPSGSAVTGTWGVVRHIGESPDPATHAAWRAWHAANGRWWAQ